jgi:hypothetical protein
MITRTRFGCERFVGTSLTLFGRVVQSAFSVVRMSHFTAVTSVTYCRVGDPELFVRTFELDLLRVAPVLQFRVVQGLIKHDHGLGADHEFDDVSPAQGWD